MQQRIRAAYHHEGTRVGALLVNLYIILGYGPVGVGKVLVVGFAHIDEAAVLAVDIMNCGLIRHYVNVDA